MPKARYALIVAGWCAIAAACGGRTPITPTPPPADPPPVDQPPPAPPPPTPVLGITRILAFGDSMTAGTTQPAYTFRLLDAGLAVSYPYKLETLLTAKYASQSIATLNAGKAGELASGSGTLDRFSRMLSEAQPEVVLLMEGANDLNNIPQGGSINEAVDKTAAAMEDMMREAVERRHLMVMLATLPPQRPGGPRTAPGTALDRYNNALRQMAAKRGYMLVDVNAQFPLELIGQDGLHPTEQGYDKLAAIFRDVIVSMYDATPATISR